MGYFVFVYHMKSIQGLLLKNRLVHQNVLSIHSLNLMQWELSNK